jgi:O-antigen/teichoic acid export membrane protein
MSDDFPQKITVGSYYLILDQIINYGLGFLFWFFLAKLLPASAIGQVMAITALAIAVLGFTGYGTQTTIAKYVAQYNAKGFPGAAKKVFHSGLKIGVIASLGAAFVITLLSNRIASSIFTDPSLAPLIVITMLMILPLQTILLSFSGIFQGLQKMKYTAGSDLVYQIVRMLTAVILAFAAPGNLGVIVGFAVGSLVAVSYAYLHYRRQLAPLENLEPPLTYPGFVKVAKFSSLNYLAIGLSTIGIQISYIVLGTQSFDSVALFGISSLISGVVGGIIISVGRAILPTTSEAFEHKDKTVFRKSVNAAFRLALMISGFTCIVLITVPAEILSLLSKEYIPAASVLQILVLYGMITSLAVFIGSLLNGLGRPLQVAMMSIASSAVTIALRIILSPLFGMFGASVSLMAGSLVNISLASYYIRKINFASISFRNITKPILAITSALSVSYLALTIAESTLIALIFSISVYLVLVVAFKVTTKSEVRRILQIATQATRLRGS